MDTIEEQFIRDLIFYKTKLRKYCHNENCRHYYICPEEHKKCKDKLNLDTSIAWVIASSLSIFIPSYVHYSDNNRPRSVKYELLNKLSNKLHTLKVVVSFHTKKYPELYDLLCNVNRTLTKHQNHVMIYNNYE